jgi:hypothetical protein
VEEVFPYVFFPDMTKSSRGSCPSPAMSSSFAVAWKPDGDWFSEPPSWGGEGGSTTVPSMSSVDLVGECYLPIDEEHDDIGVVYSASFAILS